MSHPFFIIELKADFSLDDCVDFINAITENGTKVFRNFYVALPFLRLKEITEKFPDSGITFGSSLLNNADPGAFTAEVTGVMVREVQGNFTLVGSSYERKRLMLSDVQMENKLKAAHSAGLKPVYCVEGDEELTESLIVQQLETLKNAQVIEEASHPAVIYEIPFRSFDRYFPSQEELLKAKTTFKAALTQVFGDLSEKFAILIALPSDLMGFSALIDSLPFDGAFFTKSGTHPHAVHDETVKLVHVHCEEIID